MRSWLLGVIVLLSVVAPSWQAASTAEATTLAAGCPDYADRLRRARDLLVRSERAAALGELRRAQLALAACIRREAEEDEQVVLLAALSVRSRPL